MQSPAGRAVGHPLTMTNQQTQADKATGQTFEQKPDSDAPKDNPALTSMFIREAAQHADALDAELMRVSGRVWTPHPEAGDGPDE